MTCTGVVMFVVLHVDYRCVATHDNAVCFNCVGCDNIGDAAGVGAYMADDGAHVADIRAPGGIGRCAVCMCAVDVVGVCCEWRCVIDIGVTVIMYSIVACCV